MSSSTADQEPTLEALITRFRGRLADIGPVAHWLLVSAGVLLMAGSELVFFVFGSADPLVRVLELLLPISVGIGLVWYGFQLRTHEFSSWQIGVLGLAVIVGMGLFVVLATYMRVLLSLEHTFPQEPVYLLLNAMAIGAVVNLVYAYQYIQVKARADRLEQRVSRLVTILSRASHDVRNPLNVAQGYAEIVGESLESTDSVDPLKKALGRIGSIVDELLVFAHTNHSTEAVESVSLERKARESWGMVETESGALHVEADLRFEADPDRVQHLLENLFRNAIDHAGPDTTVTVGTLETKSGFFVADDGPGIPEADRETVFEPGYTTAEEGTGFGLNIVAEIADAHDWSVSLTESEKGGTRFEFSDIETV